MSLSGSTALMKRARAIRLDYLDGASITRLASQYSITTQSVSNIVAFVTWPDRDDDLRSACLNKRAGVVPPAQAAEPATPAPRPAPMILPTTNKIKGRRSAWIIMPSGGSVKLEDLSKGEVTALITAIIDVTGEMAA